MKKNSLPFTFSKRAGDRIFIVLMLMLPLLNFAVFYVYVNFNSILLAFKVPVGDIEVWGMDNFKQMFEEFASGGSDLTKALINTMKYFFTGIIITLPLSFLMCYFLYKRVRGYRVFRVIFYLPSIISASVLVAMFRYSVAVNGPISLLFEKLGLGTLPPLFNMSKYATNTIIFYNVAFGLGANLILFSGAMTNIDGSIIEAAKIDGANMARELASIVIPITWPTISTVLIFQFVGIFSASGPILLFTKGDFDTYTISYWIYDQVKFGSSYNFPSAVGLFFTLIGAPIAILMRWVLTRFYYDDI